MLNDKSDKDVIQDELNSLRLCLMGKNYSQLDKVPTVLRLIQDMLAESHPSAYPSPETLSCVAAFLREEKFNEKRKQCGNTHQSEDLQRLIDRVKKLKTQAELARPKETPSPSWQSRDWDAGLLAQLFSVIVLAAFFILSVMLSFVAISSGVKVAILACYLGMSISLAIVIKNHCLLFASILILLFSALSLTTLSIFKYSS